jgi:IS5 family transposase
MQYYRNRNNLTLPGLETWRGSLSEKKVRLLEKSWAGIFRQYLLPQLPVHRLAENYSDHRGRPSKDLVTCMGAAVLQQVFDLTDERTCEELAFNQQWHYALDTFEQEQQLLSLKTLWSVRQALTAMGLDQEIFQRITDHLAEAFQVDTRFQRLDSVHIHSNMARLGRVRLLARTITKFLRNLRRQYREVYAARISAQMSARYLKEEADGYFGKVKPSETKKRLGEIARDLYTLIETFAEDADIRALYSYQLLERVFREQCRVEGEEVIVIPAREVSSDSLQNPSDPDAGYDGYKGQGYQVQIQETFTPAEPASEAEGPGGRDAKAAEEGETGPHLNLITHVAVEPAHEHDSAALKTALEEVAGRNLSPEELLADAAYGSDENVLEARSHSVELIAPVPGRKGEKPWDGFVFATDTQEVETCPAGKAPVRIRSNRRKGSLTAVWEESVCEGCSLRKLGRCPVVKGRQGYRWQYLAREVRNYQRRRAEEGETFQKKYRYRSGIEGTNSQYVHQLGARRLRYRGQERVRYAGIIKALGINLFRTVKYVRERSKWSKNGDLLGLQWAFYGVKLTLGRFQRILGKIGKPSPAIAGVAIVRP